MLLPIRPRRNRRSESIRSLIRETTLTPADLILPLFVHEDPTDTPIPSMPGCTRWAEKNIAQTAAHAHSLGIPAVVLFPKIPDHQKTPHAQESYNPNGLIPRVIQAIKQKTPTLTVITDIALDPYNSDGHDGIVEQKPDGTLEILNDPTIQILCQQALAHAAAGADIISPSDMMDGRIAALRAALDQQNYTHTGIMSYAVKYASSLYGPFRGALDSAPKNGDKKTYQMDPANTREAIREALLDQQEGADILMVKPAGQYLDIIHQIRQATHLPIAAYQVSGEYLMLESAIRAGWLNRPTSILESLLSIKRAGADMILTYYATAAAELL